MTSTSTLLTIALRAPSLGPSFFPPSTLTRPPASNAEATANALIARVLPTNQPPQVQTALAAKTFSPPQGTMDSFTAQYAPETYAVALSGTLTQAVTASPASAQTPAPSPVAGPTYGGTNIPYLDHEIEKIQAAAQGNAITPAPPTFASQGVPLPQPAPVQTAAPPAPQTPQPTPAPQ